VRRLQLPWLRPRGKARLETPPEQRLAEPPQREAAAIADLNAGFAKPRGHKRRRQLAMRARARERRSPSSCARPQVTARAELRDFYFNASTGEFVGESGALPTTGLPSRLIVVRHHSREEAEEQIRRQPDAYGIAT
jgi:hypothetical protein